MKQTDRHSTGEPANSAAKDDQPLITYRDTVILAYKSKGEPKAQGTQAAGAVR